MFTLNTGGEAVDAVPAATVLVVRESQGRLEVLMLKRHQDLKFMPGAWVFPGGKVDAEDAGEGPVERARAGAVRELEEEAGLRVLAENLQTFSYWLTPEVVSRRFATWFFLVPVADDVTVTVCGSEMVDYRWLTATEALSQHRAGQLDMPPPTFVSLTDLQRYDDLSTLLTAMAGREPPTFFPKVIRQDEGLCFLYEGDAGYASGDPTVAGARHRTLMRGGALDYVGLS